MSQLTQQQTKTNASNTITLSSGNRKYSPIWRKVKSEGICIVTCPRVDTVTVINGVKKEKTKDKNKPKTKVLDIEVTETGVTFKLVEEVSINNL